MAIADALVEAGYTQPTVYHNVQPPGKEGEPPLAEYDPLADPQRATVFKIHTANK